MEAAAPADAALGGPGPRKLEEAGAGGSEQAAFLMMEEILEKLKMLRYERDFLTSRRPPWPPCTRTHFAVPTPGQNTNELFHHFTSLCAHLLTLCGRRFRPPDQFDDPNATCAAIFAELKACGFATPSFAPGKLRHGHGRECVGVLKGYDALLNLVLDETREYLKDPDDPYRLLDETRSLGLTVCRGTAVTLVCPADGFEEIANPFLQEGGDDEEPQE